MNISSSQQQQQSGNVYSDAIYVIHPKEPKYIHVTLTLCHIVIEFLLNRA